MTGYAPLISGDIPFSSYCGLLIDPKFVLDGEPIGVGVLVRLYAAGWRDALRGSPNRVAAMKWQAHQAREFSPDAEVSEVAVRLGDGLHLFTWEEFEAWLDNREADDGTTVTRTTTEGDDEDRGP